MQASDVGYIWEGSTFERGEGEKGEVGFWVTQGNKEQTLRWQCWAWGG